MRAILAFTGLTLMILLQGAPSGFADEKAVKPADPLEQIERAVLYHARKYDPSLIRAFESSGGLRVNFKTEQGEQAAWLIKQTRGDKPERLWVFCGGNATLAIELSSIARGLPFDTDAFLLVDYPGYGACAGLPSPAAIRENVKGSVLAACKELDVDPKQLPKMARAFGHSLGCAAALMAADEFDLTAVVLISPFTSTTEMAQKLGLPKDFPLKHKYDNRAGLTELEKNKGVAWVFHGENDEVIPMQMSRTLKSEFKDTVELTIVVGAKHNDVIGRAKKSLAEAMTEARKGKQ